MNGNRLFMRSEHNRLLLSLLSFEERRKPVQISWMDANLIWVAPKYHNTGGPADPYHGALGRNAYFWKRRGRKRKLRMGVPYLIYVVCVELHRTVFLLGFLHQRNKKHTPPFTVMCMMDCLPCYLATSGELMLLSYRLGPHSQ
jgi:hypothetical protein